MPVKPSEPDQVQWLMAIVILVLWETHVGGLLEARSLRPVWATQQNLVSTKKERKRKKNRQMWWAASVVLATWEAEMRGSLEPRSSRLE